jgi:hypothetical protein
VTNKVTTNIHGYFLNTLNKVKMKNLLLILVSLTTLMACRKQVREGLKEDRNRATLLIDTLPLPIYPPPVYDSTLTPDTVVIYRPKHGHKKHK